MSNIKLGTTATASKKVFDTTYSRGAVYGSPIPISLGIVMDLKVKMYVTEHLDAIIYTADDMAFYVLDKDNKFTMVMQSTSPVTSPFDACTYIGTVGDALNGISGAYISKKYRGTPTK